VLAYVAHFVFLRDVWIRTQRFYRWDRKRTGEEQEGKGGGGGKESGIKRKQKKLREKERQ
jgi:hypothetical protein